MTKAEAEEIIIAVVLSGEDVIAIPLTSVETQVFRVLVGRSLKEMEVKNHTLWLKAREYGIEYKEPYAIIKKQNMHRFKLFKVGPIGELVPLVDEPIDDKI